jgi:transposase InsO family protein
LVLKDDFSHFVELVPSERTDHVVVVHALVDWYKRFGVAETHVSDKGSHFKNKVMAELNDILKTKHYFTIAYSPKSNGTVERFNREIMKVLRSLVSEFKISWNEWASLLPLVQSALNNYKSASLAGQAAITVFTGLPAYNPVAVVLQGTDAISFKQSKMKADEILSLVTDLKESLEELHKKVETSSAAETA